METLPGEITLTVSVLPPFSMGVNSLRKEFAPSGANSFLLELTSVGRILLSRKVNRKSQMSSLKIVKKTWQSLYPSIHLIHVLWMVAVTENQTLVTVMGFTIALKMLLICNLAVPLPPHYFHTRKMGLSGMILKGLKVQ